MSENLCRARPIGPLAAELVFVLADGDKLVVDSPERTTGDSGAGALQRLDALEPVHVRT